MQTWTTTHHPAGEQFSYWREVLCAAFAPLRPERGRSHGVRPDGGITSVVRSAPLGTTVCADVRSTTQRIVHGPAEIRATQEDVVFVNLQLSGRCLAEQDGRTAALTPGRLAVFDTSSEYRFEYLGDHASDEWRVLCFRVPRTQLEPLVPDLHDVTCVGIDTTRGTGAIVGSSMTAAWQHIDTLDDGGAVQNAFVTVLAARLGAGQDVPNRPRQVREATRAAVNRFVDANLCGADLRPSSVAARFAISVRTPAQPLPRQRQDLRTYGHGPAPGPLRPCAGRPRRPPFPHPARDRPRVRRPLPSRQVVPSGVRDTPAGPARPPRPGTGRVELIIPRQAVRASPADRVRRTPGPGRSPTPGP
ncbi:cupin domain-containing protein [Pseudonocardia sp. TMWB2A]|uniref:cupin domain-containing protein n=1 Tax=Pseudonocardia sp. TMWB2A TaxID=687430 RepID=UPI00307F21D8